MDIGKEKKVIIIEPLESPVPERRPEPAAPPKEAPVQPERKPEKAPA